VVIDPDPGETCELFFKHLGQRTQVFRIRDILVRIRILGSVPLINRSGFGSCSFRQWPPSGQQKNLFFAYYFLRYMYIILHR
jgi:hypothetical protein